MRADLEKLGVEYRAPMVRQERKSVSQWTRRWREPDSNHRSRLQKRAEHRLGTRESKRPIGFCKREPIPASLQEKLKI
jgi:hypothetical protein